MLGVQYFFHPPVMANTLKALWLKKGGHDSSQGCGRVIPFRVSNGRSRPWHGEGSIDAPTIGKSIGSNVVVCWVKGHICGSRVGEGGSESLGMWEIGKGFTIGNEKEDDIQ